MAFFNCAMRVKYYSPSSWSAWGLHLFGWYLRYRVWLVQWCVWQTGAFTFFLFQASLIGQLLVIIFRPPPPSHSRSGGSDYRGRGRGGYNSTSNYRGGGGGGGSGGYRGGSRSMAYRVGPTSQSSYSNSSRHPPHNPAPHHNYPPQPPNQYFTSGNRNAYDYRTRNNYPPGNCWP